MVLDLIAGGELWAVIVNQGAFSEKEAQRVIEQILLAVDYMHRYI